MKHSSKIHWYNCSNNNKEWITGKKVNWCEVERRDRDREREKNSHFFPLSERVIFQYGRWTIFVFACMRDAFITVVYLLVCINMNAHKYPFYTLQMYTFYVFYRVNHQSMLKRFSSSTEPTFSDAATFFLPAQACNAFAWFHLKAATTAFFSTILHLHNGGWEPSLNFFPCKLNRVKKRVLTITFVWTSNGKAKRIGILKNIFQSILELENHAKIDFALEVRRRHFFVSTIIPGRFDWNHNDQMDRSKGSRFKGHYSESHTKNALFEMYAKHNDISV